MLKKVEKGQKFRPSATFHNKVVDAVNAMDGFKSIGQGKGQSNDIRINFVNTLGEEIPAGAPLVIDSYDENNNIFKVRKFKAEDTVYGVNKTLVEKNKIGTIIMFGVVEIALNGEILPSVTPVPNSFTWQYADFGMPVLAPLKSGAIILISSAGKGNQNLQDRPFIASYNSETAMIDITGGWAVCNGEYKEVSKDSLGVMDGYICVVGEWNGETKMYDVPLFFYNEPAANSIPIAKITLGEDGNVNIVNFYVSTVIINETALHPPCECLTGEKK